MVRLSQERLLAAAKRVNPKARLIIKYPAVVRPVPRAGLRGAAGDGRLRPHLGRHGNPRLPRQALGRHAAVRGLLHHALAGRDRRPEMRRRLVRPLRHDRADLPGAGPADGAGRRPRVDAVLLRLAAEATPARRTSRRCGGTSPSCWPWRNEVGRRQIVGVAAYKPANSHPEKEPRVFDFVGMLGLPLVPCHEFPAEAQAAFFSIHALKDPELAGQAGGFHRLRQAGAAHRRPGEAAGGQGGPVGAPTCSILPVKGDPKSLLELPQAELDALRAAAPAPLGPYVPCTRPRGPVPVCRWKLGDRELQRRGRRRGTGRHDSGPLPPRGWLLHWKGN